MSNVELSRQAILKILGQPSFDFDGLALRVFAHQAEFNPLYNRFLTLLGVDAASVKQVADIPFLPISLFKQYSIQTGEWSPETQFSSSATTGTIPSQHAVRDLSFYRDNTIRGFLPAYGDPADWMVLALLPAYLERSGSSLVVMAEHFICRSKYAESDFFLHNLSELAQVLVNRPSHARVLLLGVTFALLDFAAQFSMDLQGVTIMETGGMKGRRREMTRAEVHAVLQTAFNVPVIHSEYGMTELFSQGYSTDGQYFSPAPTLRMLTKELNDPFATTKSGRAGVLHAIDLANFDTCSFIATEDIGRCYEDGRFEVLGRLDIAELRGCNLMVE
jgi:phenylacetate-coenzyme A ligase PaaK-like adenylate-forming protein